MVLNINITHFSPTPVAGHARATHKSILKNPGLVDQLINEIDTQGGNDQQKFTDFMSCLSQVLSSNGRLKGECESKLRAKVFSFSKAHPDDAELVIKQDRFKYDSKLKPTIEKVEYLVSSYAGKYFHHLKNALGDNKRSGVSYFTFGIGAMLGGQGLQIILSQDPNTANDHNKINVAWATFATGAAMLLFPIINPARLAFQDEPLNP